MRIVQRDGLFPEKVFSIEAIVAIAALPTNYYSLSTNHFHHSQIFHILCCH